MTAVLQDLDRSTIDDLRKHIPNLSALDLPKLELPRMQEVGKGADEAIDRLLGRSRPSIWPWVAWSIGLVAVLGAVAAWFAWYRKPTWGPRGARPVDGRMPDIIAAAESEGMTGEPATDLGVTAVEASLMSRGYPDEEA